MKLLLNYANAKYRASQRINSRSGLEVGNFDAVISYGSRNIDVEFAARHARILRHKVGNGYWLWKPYFMQQALAQLCDGDFLFYCDAGAKFIAAIDPLVELCQVHDQDVIPFELQQIERVWTKRDAFVLLDCDSDILANAKQRLASFILLRKSKFSVAFVEQYLHYACDARALTDQHNELAARNYDDFVAHRHDQSIFSLLTKRHGLKAFRDPSQWGNGLLAEYPTSEYGQLIEHTRKRTHPVLRNFMYRLDPPSGTMLQR